MLQGGLEGFLELPNLGVQILRFSSHEMHCQTKKTKETNKNESSTKRESEREREVRSGRESAAEAERAARATAMVALNNLESVTKPMAPQSSLLFSRLD